MKTREILVKELQEILEIINDSKEGYDNASKNTSVNELRLIFSGYALERASYVKDIQHQIESLNGNSDLRPRSPLGPFPGTWLDIKAALNSNNIKKILDIVVLLEQSTAAAYEKVLSSEAQHSKLYVLLSHQCFGIKRALRIIETFSLECESN